MATYVVYAALRDYGSTGHLDCLCGCRMPSLAFSRLRNENEKIRFQFRSGPRVGLEKRAPCQILNWRTFNGSANIAWRYVMNGMSN